MSEPEFLSQCCVAILGLGLMGGSLAKALAGKCRLILGVDPDEHAGKLAMHEGIIAGFSTQPADILSQADLIVLAAPVRKIIETIAQIPDLHPGKAVILDLGSTKQEICHALERLPARFDPLGGHPMCGKTESGMSYADESLFLGAAFALTPLPRTTERARRLGEELVQAVGARALWLDANLHDRWVASSSHIPYLVAIALALATPPDAGPLIGPGFRSTTRVAASSVVMMQDILVTNQAYVLEAVERVRNSLQVLEDALAAGNDERLNGLLTLGKERHQRLLRTLGGEG
jgi:prephenate dehydrogenase